MRELASVRGPVLPDLLRPGLRIVFCGTAAGTVSAARGAYYAHPQNRFWSALHAAGLTPRQLRPEEFGLLPQWGLGLTDIAKTRERHGPGIAAGRFGPPGLRGTQGQDRSRRAGAAGVYEPRRRAPLSRPRRRFRRAARAHRAERGYGSCPRPRRPRVGTGRGTSTGGERSRTRRSGRATNLLRKIRIQLKLPP